MPGKIEGPPNVLLCGHTSPWDGSSFQYKNSYLAGVKLGENGLPDVFLHLCLTLPNVNTQCNSHFTRRFNQCTTTVHHNGFLCSFCRLAVSVLLFNLLYHFSFVYLGEATQ
jgi:hypothetical protein